MKKVEAIIDPFMLAEVKAAVLRAGIEGMTVWEVKGHIHDGHVEQYRGTRYIVDFDAKVKLELIVADEQITSALDIIEECVRTVPLGDAKIFVSPVEQAIRVRTGERNEGALCGSGEPSALQAAPRLAPPFGGKPTSVAA
jgi:nitrogen regulatory protein P-II 1